MVLRTKNLSKNVSVQTLSFHVCDHPSDLPPGARYLLSADPDPADADPDMLILIMLVMLVLILLNFINHDHGYKVGTSRSPRGRASHPGHRSPVPRW